MRRVLFSRSAIVGWPKLAADGQTIEKRPNGQPVVVRHRCRIGDEIEVPDDVAEELVKGGLAGYYHQGGLTPAAQHPPHTALPPPISPDPAFAIRQVEESPPEDEVAAMEAAAISNAAPPQRSGPGLRQYVR